MILTKHILTRMHSSRMCTSRSLTVCRSMLPGGAKKCKKKIGGGVCFGGGVWSWEGGVWSWGVVYSWGVWSRGCLVWGCLVWGVSTPGRCLLWGVSAPGGGCLVWGVSAPGRSGPGGVWSGGVSTLSVCVCSRGCLVQGVSGPRGVSALGGLA